MLYYLALFLLLYTAVSITPDPLTKRSAIHNAIWLLSPVWGDFVSLSTTAFAFTINAVVAVPLSDAIPILCSPAESVAT